MTIDIFDIIDPYFGTGVKSIREQLSQIKENEDLTVYINSPGGSVFEGIAIYNLLSEYNPTVKVIGEASSIASVIAMSAAPGKLLMAESASMLLHRPWSMMIGDEDDAAKLSEDLKKVKNMIIKVYKQRSGMSDNDIEELLLQDTYHSAEDCVKMKLADDIYKPAESEKKKAQKTISFLSQKLVAMALRENDTNKSFSNTNQEEIMEVEALKSKISSLEAKLELNDKTLSDVKDESKDLKAQIDKLSNERDNLLQSKNELEGNIKTLKAEIAKFSEKELEMKVDNFMAQNNAKIKPTEKDDLRAELLIALNDEGDESRKINGKSPYERLTENITKRTSAGEHGFSTNALGGGEDDWDRAFDNVRKNKNK